MCEIISEVHRNLVIILVNSCKYLRFTEEKEKKNDYLPDYLLVYQSINLREPKWISQSDYFKV